MLEDPRRTPAFTVKVVSDAHHATDAQDATAVRAGRTSLAQALLDFPVATDDDLARLVVYDDEEPPDDVRARGLDAVVYVVRGAPGERAKERVAELAASARAKTVLVAVHARDLASHDERGDEALLEAWATIVSPSNVYLTSTPTEGSARGVDELRAAIVQHALEGIDVSVERARRAKRPYATAIVAGAALVTAAEGFLPGAAAFVIATQVGAITSLYYLYSGKWMGRRQALSLLPVFASEAAGGSAFLLVKSFLPPTGVADVVAAGVASSMTIAMLGAVTWALEHGYSLDQKAQLKLAFKRMQAKTKAERAEIARNRHRWKDKEFWTDVVRRMIFD